MDGTRARNNRHIYKHSFKGAIFALGEITPDERDGGKDELCFSKLSSSIIERGLSAVALVQKENLHRQFALQATVGQWSYRVLSSSSICPSNY